MLRSRRLKTPILQGFLSVKIANTVFYTFALKNGLLLRNTAIENWIIATLTIALPSRKSWNGLPAFSFVKIRKESLCRKSHRQQLRPPPPQSRRPSSGKSAKPPMNYRYISVRQAQSVWAIKSCGYWKMTYPQRNEENFSLCPWQTDRKGPPLIFETTLLFEASSLPAAGSTSRKKAQWCRHSFNGRAGLPYPNLQNKGPRTDCAGPLLF